ncbi:MAG: SWIM zinc finger family protein [Candidatus Hadarchaeales archaeon]
MLSQDFNKKKIELFGLLRKERKLSGEVRRKIIELYGSRGEKAIEAVEQRRVRKQGRRWFVRGKSGEYEVVKNFCSCPDYVMNIATEKAKVDMCYHALAKEIAEAIGFYREEKDEKGESG